MDISKLIRIIIMALNVVMGLVCLACGIWFHASKEIYAYMSIFVLNQNDKLLIAAAGMMLAIGVFLTLFSVFGVLSLVLKKLNKFHNLVYIGLVLIMILGFIAGFLPVGLRYDIFRYVKQGMKDQLTTYYDSNSKLGREWNRVQVKKRCCGVDGSWDYADTNWYNEQNDPDDPKRFVPDSCCTLNFNQDREINWVDPQNLQLKDPVRCQEDARGKVANSANINGKGCFVALFSKNPDIWLDQSIWTVMDVISGVCLTAAVWQIVVLLVSNCLPLREMPAKY